jgi:hypothetical protein
VFLFQSAAVIIKTAGSRSCTLIARVCQEREAETLISSVKRRSGKMLLPGFMPWRHHDNSYGEKIMSTPTVIAAVVIM